MSILNGNAQEELLARLKSDSGEQPEAQKTIFETQTYFQTPATQETQSLEEVSETPERSIPYDRFKRVNDSKKEYQRKFEEQTAELQGLKKELENKSAQSLDSNWLDDLLKEDSSEDSNYSALEKRVQSFEMKEAERELSTMVRNSQKANKDLDTEVVEAVIYQTIATDPHADIDDALDNLRNFMQYARNSDKDKQTREPAAERHVAAPRASSVGQKGYVPQTTLNKPRTLADARESLYNYLKGQ